MVNRKREETRKRTQREEWEEKEKAHIWQRRTSPRT